MKSHVMLCSLLFLGFAWISEAAEKPNVSALPISNRLIQGEISLANGEVVKFTSLEGSLVTIQSADVGSFALSGQILGEDDVHVRFTLFKIDEYGPGLHGLRELEHFEVRGKSPEPTSQAGIPEVSATGIRISDKFSQEQIDAFREAKLASVTGIGPAESAALIPEIEGICCVTCGTNSACGCTVTLSCGNCCSDACCPSTGTGKPKPQNQF